MPTSGGKDRQGAQLKWELTALEWKMWEKSGRAPSGLLRLYSQEEIDDEAATTPWQQPTLDINK